MEDLKKIIEELNDKKEEKKCDECKDCNCKKEISAIPVYQQDDNFWVMGLLMLCLLGFPQKKKNNLLLIFI